MFLKRFKLEIELQNALVALTNIIQKISEYFRQFNTVVIRFLENHFTGETICHYFIPDFNKQITIQEELNVKPTMVNEALEATRHLEKIEMEINWMWNGTVALILAHYLFPQIVNLNFGESWRSSHYNLGYIHLSPIN